MGQNSQRKVGSFTTPTCHGSYSNSLNSTTAILGKWGIKQAVFTTDYSPRLLKYLKPWSSYVITQCSTRIKTCNKQQNVADRFIREIKLQQKLYAIKREIDYMNNITRL